MKRHMKGQWTYAGCFSLWENVAYAGFGFVMPLLLSAGICGAGMVAKIDFADGMDGLINQGNPDTLHWTWSSDHAAVLFPPTSSLPMPGEHALLVGGAGTVEGALTGNFRETGIVLLGFDFRADELIPRNGVRVDIEGAAGVIYKDFTSRILSAGAWHRVILRLDDLEAGGWSGAADAEHFDAILSDVQHVRFYLARSGHSASQTYRLDNLFVGRLHRLTCAEVAEKGRMSLSWSGLLDHTSYRLESTDNLSEGPWLSDEVYVKPTGDIHWMAPPPGEKEVPPVRFYRLVLE